MPADTVGRYEDLATPSTQLHDFLPDIEESFYESEDRAHASSTRRCPRQCVAGCSWPWPAKASTNRGTGSRTAEDLDRALVAVVVGWAFAFVPGVGTFFPGLGIALVRCRRREKMSSRA
jgi:hypothetical protein